MRPHPIQDMKRNTKQTTSTAAKISLTPVSVKRFHEPAPSEKGISASMTPTLRTSRAADNFSNQSIIINYLQD
jgi:hypothetical protein